MKKQLYILLLSPIFFISSCDKEPISGCLDSQACNYNPEATLDNNSCEYATDGFDCDDVIGCTDSLACNFNSEAIPDNNLCEYAIQGYDCNGNEIFQIGDQYSGGIVFYVDETGQHGLVAAMEDLEETYEWGCLGVNADGADATSIGTGYQNTIDIVNQGCFAYDGGISAAQAAMNAEINGYSDWYLPSKFELEEMYYTIGQGGPEGNIGGFEDSYWSSSEEDDDDAWFVYFDNGNTRLRPKPNSFRVRVIRTF